MVNHASASAAPGRPAWLSRAAGPARGGPGDTNLRPAGRDCPSHAESPADSGSDRDGPDTRAVTPAVTETAAVAAAADRDSGLRVGVLSESECSPSLRRATGTVLSESAARYWSFVSWLFLPGRRIEGRFFQEIFNHGKRS